jgi:hypothetical protein
MLIFEASSEASGTAQLRADRAFSSIGRAGFFLDPIPETQ